MKHPKKQNNYRIIGFGVLAVLVLTIALVSSRGEYFQGSLKIGGTLKQAAPAVIRDPILSDAKHQSGDAISRAELAQLIVATMQVDATSYTACAPDVAGTWYENYVCYLMSKGIFATYPDGKFNANNTVNRAEGAKTFTLAFIRPATWYTGRITAFSDVLPADWFYVYVMTLAQNNVLDVKLPTDILSSPNLKPAKPQFNPGQPLTKSSAVQWAQNVSTNVLKK